MKKRIIYTALFFALCIYGADAQQSLKGMSLNGSTGLYLIPSGRIGWEQSANFGLDLGYHSISAITRSRLSLDLGYHSIIDGSRAAHIPALSLSLFKWVELSAAFDFQPDSHNGVAEDGNDFIGGFKIQFPSSRTAVSLGGNFQSLNMGNDTGDDYLAGQIYLAVTYAGDFFNMPAETTVVLGKTFREVNANSDIDFGMGFDLVLLPNIFDGFVHWVTDFSNFSYSDEAFDADAGARGVLNSGVRVDLSRIPALSGFKFVLDILITDAFDSGRAFSAGLVFGVPIL